MHEYTCRSRDKAPYCASKHGVVGFTKSLALETAGSGITCNAICPGFVKTPLLDAQVRPQNTPR